MGIETILTIAVAAAILAAAVVLRFVVTGAFYLGRMAWKNLHAPSGRHRAPSIEQALPRTRIAERAARVASGLGALALFVAAVVATGARAAYVWAQPRTIAGYRRGRAETLKFYRWLRVETEEAYSGRRGATTYQAIGETATTWGGRPHVVLTPY